MIVVTGETDEVFETKLIEEGADDYIRKLLDPLLFLARIAATIRGRSIESAVAWPLPGPRFAVDFPLPLPDG